MTKQIAISLLLLFITSYLISGQADFEIKQKYFSKDELIADLSYLKNKLETTHPSLYLYNSSFIIQAAFDSLAQSLSKPQTELEFYKSITILSSIIKDGHTLLLPSIKSTEYHDRNSLFLPFHFVILNNQLYVDQLCTMNNSIPIGSEVLSINDIPTNEIIKQLTDRQVRDGNNQTYPLWIISTYFREYFSYIFGHPENYKISYKIDEKLNTVLINGLSKDSIFFYRNQRYPDKVFYKIPKDGIKLKLFEEKKFALLTIKDFHNSVLKNEYKQNFKKVISSYFDQLKKSKADNLIIDIRNNQGGDIENAVFLLSYLLDKPFAVVQGYLTIKNGQLCKCSGPSMGIHKIKSNNFHGKLYVLINGGSFSNSGIVSSCLQANNRAIFIGQESGGNPDIISGFVKELSLPKTKIRLQLPTKQFRITTKQKIDGHGVLPNIVMIPKLEDIIENIDTELNMTIDIIVRSSR